MPPPQTVGVAAKGPRGCGPDPPSVRRGQPAHPVPRAPGPGRYCSGPGCRWNPQDPLRPPAEPHTNGRLPAGSPQASGSAPLPSATLHMSPRPPCCIVRLPPNLPLPTDRDVQAPAATVSKPPPPKCKWMGSDACQLTQIMVPLDCAKCFKRFQIGDRNDIDEPEHGCSCLPTDVVLHAGVEELVWKPSSVLGKPHSQETLTEFPPGMYQDYHEGR